MAINYLQNQISGEVLSILKSRRNYWELGRNAQPHIKDAMRNNAWAKVTIDGLSLSRNDDKFQQLYGRGQSLAKPPPSLNKVVIKYRGEGKLAIQVDVSFTCHLRADFINFEKRWLRAGKVGSVEWGYVKPYNPAEQKYIGDLGEVTVATFDYNTDSNNHYHCNLMMIGASKFAESAEAKGGLKDSGQFKYKTKSYSGGVSTHEVTSLDELLLFDAQNNGETVTDDMGDNVKIPSSYGDIIVYKPPTKGGIGATLGKFAEQFANRDNKQFTLHSEYYSLEYIVERLINEQILGFIKDITSSKDKQLLANVKIVCNSTVSRGYGYPIVRSADPNSLLILGGSRGTYINSSTGEGKDWEKGGEGAGDSINCHKGDFVDHSKLMFERKAITMALSAGSERSEETGAASKTNQTEKSPVLVYVERFLKELFSLVAKNTGNLFHLDMIENPDNRDELLIIDRNYANPDTLKVFLFDPIDGDGSTRTMEISSGAGSKDYQAAMYNSVVKQSDINGTIKEDVSEADGKRASENTKTIAQIIIKYTTTLPDSGFSTDEVNGMRTLLSRYNQTLTSEQNKKQQVILYPGLKISMTLDGVWGWRAGNHVSTTLMPPSPYLVESNGLAFNIQSVTHTIQNNDWETSLDGLITVKKPITFV